MKGGLAAESEESSGEPSLVDITRYKQLGLQQALVKDGLHALLELTALFRTVYASRASKAVQQAMYDDAWTAVTLLDRHRVFMDRVSQLVKVVEKLLPQQSKKRLLTESKRTCLALARHAKLRSDVEDADEACGPSLDGLPTEVARLILRHLDPVSLEAMASCNRQWRTLALSDDLWQQWSLHLFPRAAASEVEQQACHYGQVPRGTQLADCKWHIFFKAQLKGSPVLFDLRCQRILVDDIPCWRPPCSLRGLTEIQADLGVPSKQAATTKREKLLSVPMVVSWVQGARMGCSDSDDSSSEASGSDSSACADATQRACVTRRLKLWSLPRV